MHGASIAPHARETLWLESPLPYTPLCAVCGGGPGGGEQGGGALQLPHLHAQGPAAGRPRRRAFRRGARRIACRRRRPTYCDRKIRNYLRPDFRPQRMSWSSTQCGWIASARQALVRRSTLGPVDGLKCQMVTSARAKQAHEAEAAAAAEKGRRAAEGALREARRADREDAAHADAGRAADLSGLTCQYELVLRSPSWPSDGVQAEQPMSGRGPSACGCWLGLLQAVATGYRQTLMAYCA